jgi:hypothetical protein
VGAGSTNFNRYVACLTGFTSAGAVPLSGDANCEFICQLANVARGSAPTLRRVNPTDRSEIIAVEADPDPVAELIKYDLNLTGPSAGNVNPADRSAEIAEENAAEVTLTAPTCP